MTQYFNNLFTAVLFCSLIVFSNTVSANYREAIDALYEEDDEKVLLALDKVVDKKYDQDVHLFISHLYFQRNKHTFNSESKKLKSRPNRSLLFNYSTLFNDQQKDKLLNLLIERIEHTAKNNAYFESRAFLIILANDLKKHQRAEFSQEWQKLAADAAGKISDPALIQYISALSYRTCGKSAFSQFDCLKLSAELGEPYAQSYLGHIYLGEEEKRFHSLYDKMTLDYVPLDMVKANYWLEQAIYNSTFAQSPHAFCTVAKQYRFGTAGRGVDLKQAYLLYLWHEAGAGASDCSENALTSMFKMRQLAKVAPSYHRLWEKDNRKPSNQMVVEDLEQIHLRKGKKSELIFSFSSFVGTVLIYSDGVGIYKFGPTTIDKWQASPLEMKEFIAAIHSLKLENMPLYLGMLYDDRVSWNFTLSFSYQGKSKAIWGENQMYSRKVNRIITQVFPNAYILCTKKNKPCLYNTDWLQ